MKTKNSEVFQVLYCNADIKIFLLTLQKLFDAQVNLSVSIETYKNNEDFIRYEKQLFDGIERQKRITVTDAIANLVERYTHYGIEPTANDSGRYNMIHFLMEIREFIAIVSPEWFEDKR